MDSCGAQELLDADKEERRKKREEKAAKKAAEEALKKAQETAAAAGNEGSQQAAATAAELAEEIPQCAMLRAFGSCRGDALRKRVLKAHGD